MTLLCRAERAQERVARLQLVAQDELRRNRFLLRIEGKHSLQARLRREQWPGGELQSQSDVPPLSVQQSRAGAQRWHGWNEDPHRASRQQRDGVERTPKPRRVRLLCAEEAVGARTVELGDQLLVVNAVRGVSVCAQKPVADRTERDEIEAKEGARSDCAPYL